MADELRIQASIQLNNGAMKIPQLGGAFTVDQATAEAGTPGLLELSTSWEDVAFGDLTAAWVFVKNLDDTDDVAIGVNPGTEAELGRLSPGEWCVLPLSSGTTLCLKASANTPNAQVVGFAA